MNIGANKKYAIITIAHLRFRHEDSTFYRFLDSSIKVINNNGIRKVVLDVRDNNGGEAVAGRDLYAMLSDYQFKYFDSMEERTNKMYQYSEYTDVDTGYYNNWQYVPLSGTDGYTILKHPLFGLQRQHYPNYNGELYVLVNGGSMSATAIFCDILYTNHRAIFIGEECGGGYKTCNGNAVNLTLPLTRIAFSIPLRKFYISASGNPFKNQCLDPDIKIKNTYSDFIKGKDRVMDYTLKLMQRKSLEGF